MGIFKRIKNIVSAQTNGLLDQIEQPVQMLNQYVREAEADLAKGEHSLANQIYLEKKQMILIAQTKEILAKRERQARIAVERGEEEIAKIALQEKIIQEDKLKLYEDQYEAIKAQTATLNEKLKELQEKLNDFKHRQLLLSSKMNVMTSLKQIDDTFSFFNTDHIAKGFARVEDRILMLESELQARQQFLPSSSKISPVQIDAGLQDKVQKQLEELKGSTNHSV